MIEAGRISETDADVMAVFSNTTYAITVFI